MELKINRRQIFLIFIDAFLVTVSLYLALLLRFDFNIQEPYFQRYQDLVFTVVMIRLAIFYAFGLYRRLWQYASIEELNAVVLAVTFSSAFIYGYTHIIQTTLPRSTYIISWILNIGLIGGVRFALRLLKRSHQCRAKDAVSRVLIVGAGSSGAIVVQELQRHFSVKKKLPVGFIDDDPAKQRCAIHGIKVLGTRDDIPQIVEKYEVDEIIISIPTASGDTIKKLTRICSQLPVKVNILPGVYELLNGDVSISKIRPVQIEDLLGREEVIINLDEVAGYLSGETVLVTGAGGSIGSELCRQVAKFKPAKILLLDHTENNVYDIEMEMLKLCPNCELVPIVADVRDPDRINSVFSTYSPTVIFHAAAHKHVPLMECNREEAIYNNVFGTKNVAEAADRFHAKSFLLISTDKAVNPTSVMGATKRVAEMVIQSLAKKSKTRYCAVRFGNVLGSRGSVIPLFKKQIEEGGPVTITDPKMTRYFMTIPEAVQLVIQAGAMGEKGEIFVLDMGEPVKIMDLARDLIRLSGFEPEKDINISVTGIRPGEKLFEEVLTDEEGTKATKHERIFIAKATEQNGTVFCQELSRLSEILFLDLNSYSDEFMVSFLECQVS
ncbi:MAG: polysaccharide biosynthesis protein [Clostridiales bacterium]|jgi:FlaA1/EpsC-like NDP-sugar epimerase|nr:polysaccharide biosynthesis protein [Clostridiales bacterium]